MEIHVVTIYISKPQQKVTFQANPWGNFQNHKRNIFLWVNVIS